MGVSPSSVASCSKLISGLTRDRVTFLEFEHSCIYFEDKTRGYIYFPKIIFFLQFMRHLHPYIHEYFLSYLYSSAIMTDVNADN